MNFLNFIRQSIRFFRRISYRLHGRKPWSYGYPDYKNDHIARVLVGYALMNLFRYDQQLPHNYSQRLDERLVEFPWLITHLPSSPGQRILDAGSTINFDYIINHPVWQKHDITIMTLAPEPVNFLQKSISYVYGDLRQTPFRDDWFDIITCISTLEHVGMNNEMYTSDITYHEADAKSHLQVIAEFERILKKGGRLYLTVPYGIFKLCGFQQVFNAAMIQALKATFGGKVIVETYFRYTNDGWQLSNAADCANCDYFDINTTKKYESDFAAAARAVACLILEK